MKNLEERFQFKDVVSSLDSEIVIFSYYNAETLERANRQVNTYKKFRPLQTSPKVIPLAEGFDRGVREIINGQE